jgi:hypothetical protein
MVQVTPQAPASISDLNTSSSVTNGKCDKICEIVIKKLDLKIEIALKKEDSEVSDLGTPGSIIDVNNSSSLVSGKWNEDVRIKKCDVKILRVNCDQKSCVGGHNDDAEDSFCYEVPSRDKVIINKVQHMVKRKNKCVRRAGAQVNKGEGRRRAKCESNVPGRVSNLERSGKTSLNGKEHYQYTNIMFQCVTTRQESKQISQDTSRLYMRESAKHSSVKYALMWLGHKHP